jgi:hypothetical protein
MTFEARLASVLFFLLVWCLVGLLPWAAAAVLSRGRGAALALPLCLAAACASGIAVPALGARDSSGFVLSIFAAFFGSALAALAGTVMGKRLEGERASGFEPGSLPQRRRDTPPDAPLD